MADVSANHHKGNWGKVRIQPKDFPEVGAPEDDGGEVAYHFDTGAGIEVTYRGGAVLQTSSMAVTMGVASPNNPIDSIFDLEWNKDKNSHYILVGDDRSGSAKFLTSNPPSNWMNVAYDLLQCWKLRELCIPGTHDSGMYTADNLRAPSIEASVATQT
jgi:hypothetical protein